MARVTKGKTFTALELQPGWKIAYNDDGTITGSCNFLCESSGIEAMMPRKGTPHPKNNKMQSFRAEGVAGEAGMATISVEYLGLSRDPSDPKIAFMGSLNQEPIESNPDFESDIGGSPEAPKNGAQFDDEGHFTGFPNNAEAKEADLVGMTGYFRPGVVYRATFFTARPNNFRLDQMRKTTSSPIGLPAGVRLPTGGNWLIGPSSMEPYGNIFKISIDYMLSGEGGWNPKVYKPAS